MSTGAKAEDLYFIHNDHLGTAQVITDKDQTVVWQGDYQPFGAVEETIAEIENPTRFPGQYFDQETGLHYNLMRDYDPVLGRYLQSDPIGLDGGINIYGYASQNPVRYYDPNGEYFWALLPWVLVGIEGGVITSISQWTLLAVLSALIASSSNADTEECDICFTRWESEDSACNAWSNLGSRVVRACKVRASDRRNLCVANGGTPDPMEPPEYSPFLDLPR